MKRLMIGTAIAVLAVPAAYAQSRSVDYAEVVDARPIYREVRVPERHEECWDERVPVRTAHVDPTSGAIIGGILGYVAGNQIGKGRGRDTARVAGAIIGTSQGSRYARERAGRGGEYTYQTRCRVLNGYRYETRVDGYNVTYRYHGRIYHTHWPHHPGSRIPVDVNVRPVRYSGSY